MGLQRSRYVWSRDQILTQYPSNILRIRDAKYLISYLGETNRSKSSGKYIHHLRNIQKFWNSSNCSIHVFDIDNRIKIIMISLKIYTCLTSGFGWIVFSAK